MCSNNVILVLVSFQTNRPTTSFCYERYAGEVNKFYSAATWTWLKIGIIKIVFFLHQLYEYCCCCSWWLQSPFKAYQPLFLWASVVRTHTFSWYERCGANKCLLITERRNVKCEKPIWTWSGAGSMPPPLPPPLPPSHNRICHGTVTLFLCSLIFIIIVAKLFFPVPFEKVR